mmetsp:Transcript_56191/g.64144  ORF Transcript_56191/g.64144 Transcript_56191/m.64144 type:complete len:96 (-) Transcript_56191:376-663(-)
MVPTMKRNERRPQKEKETKMINKREKAFLFHSNFFMSVLFYMNDSVGESYSLASSLDSVVASAATVSSLTSSVAATSTSASGSAVSGSVVSFFSQ